MHGPTRTALAALALALGVLCAGPPAQAFGTQPVERPSADAAQAAHGRKALTRPSGVVTQMSDWVVTSGDSGGLPFVIVDKLAARVFVYGPDGRLQGASPVLVGLARGDDSAPGVGDRDLAALPRNERTTPAGRFVASFGPADGHSKVLWVDYTTAISLHPVVTANPKERRLQRLRSRAPKDHRISYGCINVPAAFYTKVVLKAFEGGRGIVYILPDTKPLEEVFPAFAILAQAHAQTHAMANSAGGARASQAASADQLQLR